MHLAREPPALVLDAAVQAVREGLDLAERVLQLGSTLGDRVLQAGVRGEQRRRRSRCSRLQAARISATPLIGSSTLKIDARTRKASRLRSRASISARSMLSMAAKRARMRSIVSRPSSRRCLHGEPSSA